MSRIMPFFLLVFLAGCAETTITPIDYADRSPKTRGLRVYDPKPLLVVTSNNTSVVFVPDFNRAYAVTFHAFLSKNNVTIKTTDGALTELSSDLDTTQILSFFESLGKEALAQAKDLKALGTSVDGTIPDKQGVYEFVFDQSGSFVGLKKIAIP